MLPNKAFQILAIPENNNPSSGLYKNQLNLSASHRNKKLLPWSVPETQIEEVSNGCQFYYEHKDLNS